jgi:hypothetical protein
MKDLVMNMEDLDGGNMGIYCAAIKLLNRVSVDRAVVQSNNHSYLYINSLDDYLYFIFSNAMYLLSL